jgi:hypothetical protein
MQIIILATGGAHTQPNRVCKYRQYAAFIKTNTANVFTRRNRTYFLSSGVEEKSISLFVIVTQHLFFEEFLRQRHCLNHLCLLPGPALPNAICDAATRETRRLLRFLGAKPTNRAVCGGSSSRKRADIQFCLSLCVPHLALWVLCVDESSTSNQPTFKASR